MDHDFVRESYLKKIAEYGLPSPPILVAYDAINCLLAVALYNGPIKIYGLPGVERSFPVPVGVSLMHLVFASVSAKILAIDTKHTIFSWDIISCRQEAVVPVGFEVTAIEIPRGSSTMLVAARDGRLESRCTSTLEILPYQCSPHVQHSPEISKKIKYPWKIVKIISNRENMEEIYIAYASGIVSLFNLATTSLVKSFNTDDAFLSEEGLTTFCVLNSGVSVAIIAVFHPHYVVVWTYNTTNTEEYDYRVFDIKKMLSSTDCRQDIVLRHILPYQKHTSKSSLFRIFMSSCANDEDDGLFLDLTYCMNTKNLVIKDTFHLNVIDMALVISSDDSRFNFSEWLGSFSRNESSNAIALVTRDGVVSIRNIDDSMLSLLNPPHSLEMAASPICAFSSLHLESSSISTLQEKGTTNFLYPSGLSGGILLEKSDKKIVPILFQVSADGLVYIWNISQSYLKWIHKLDLHVYYKALGVSEDVMANEIRVEFRENSLNLFICLQNGMLLRFVCHLNGSKLSGEKVVHDLGQIKVSSCDNQFLQNVSLKLDSIFSLEMVHSYHNSNIMALLWHQDFNVLITVDDDGFLYITALESGILLASSPVSIVCLPDGKHLYLEPSTETSSERIKGELVTISVVKGFCILQRQKTYNRDSIEMIVWGETELVYLQLLKNGNISCLQVLQPPFILTNVVEFDENRILLVSSRSCVLYSLSPLVNLLSFDIPIANFVVRSSVFLRDKSLLLMENGRGEVLGVDCQRWKETFYMELARQSESLVMKEDNGLLTVRRGSHTLEIYCCDHDKQDIAYCTLLRSKQASFINRMSSTMSLGGNRRNSQVSRRDSILTSTKADSVNFSGPTERTAVVDARALTDQMRQRYNIPASQASEAIGALGQRGDKLQIVNERFQNYANAASNFAEAAKRLEEKNKAKKFY